MSQPQEKPCSHGQMEKFGHFGPFSGQATIFAKKLTATVFSTYGSLTSRKIYKKLMSQSWEKFD